jgi:iron uptake system component EfeO
MRIGSPSFQRSPSLPTPTLPRRCLLPASWVRPSLLAPSLLALSWLTLGAAMLAACSSSSSPRTDVAFQAQVVSGMRSSFVDDLSSLVSSSQALQAAAPANLAGWTDAAVASLQTPWIASRTAYEHIEGATAPIYPDIDYSIDSRYDDFLAALGSAGDSYLFDDLGVTGMHAVERILYVKVTPARVVTYEATLPGYVAAAWPATDQEANDFKNRLVQKQIADAQSLHDKWEAATNYDLGAAFQGLVSLMNEQREKVDKASTNQEESRYSQRTMADIRANLAGTEKVYALFQPWIRSKSAAGNDAGGGDAGGADAGALDGTAIDANIEQGFATLQALYDGVSGDAIPQPPADWSSENPTATDLGTPFGVLYAGVLAAVDPTRPGSIVAQMNDAAVLLGFPQFTEM